MRFGKSKEIEEQAVDQTEINVEEQYLSSGPAMERAVNQMGKKHIALPILIVACVVFVIASFGPIGLRALQARREYNRLSTDLDKYYAEILPGIYHRAPSPDYDPVLEEISKVDEALAIFHGMVLSRDIDDEDAYEAEEVVLKRLEELGWISNIQWHKSDANTKGGYENYYGWFEFTYNASGTLGGTTVGERIENRKFE